MNKILLEYVWIDAYGNTRSKIKIIKKQHSNFNLADIPEWNFDGSSTGQADGTNSDIIIKPCAIYTNPFFDYIEAYLVLSECLNKDHTPHETNHRHKLIEVYSKCIEHEPWIGIEQEYVIFERRKEQRYYDSVQSIYGTNVSLINIPYKWENHDEPGFGPQGPYYCGVGGGVSMGREISQTHLEMCLKAGLEICGTNAEVMCSQWEYQIGTGNPIEISDQLWISRYILDKITEKYNCIISFEPKPYIGDWNGSGAHTNFSTIKMRRKGGIDAIIEGCEKLALTHKKVIGLYGNRNEKRLNGKHETSSIDDFSWGISDRGKSIRIPLNVYESGCGYLEDRRPGANMDPYLVSTALCNSICLETDDEDQIYYASSTQNIIQEISQDL